MFRLDGVLVKTRMKLCSSSVRKIELFGRLCPGDSVINWAILSGNRVLYEYETMNSFTRNVLRDRYLLETIARVGYCIGHSS